MIVGEGSRVLVTGGAGFMPSHVVDRLIGRGAEVVAVDNFITGSKENVAHLDGHSRFALRIRSATTGVSAIARSSLSSFDPSGICMKRFFGRTTPTLISSSEIGMSQNHPESLRATMRMSFFRSPSSSGTPL